MIRKQVASMKCCTNPIQSTSARPSVRYLLDTNDLVRNPQGRVAARIREVGEAQVCTSIIVAAELRYGAAKRGSQRLSEQLDAILNVIEILALDARADEVYGELRAELELAGTPIGGNDLPIAAQALALECAVVTDNEREFRRVAGLRCENWLREA